VLYLAQCEQTTPTAVLSPFFCSRGRLSSNGSVSQAGFALLSPVFGVTRRAFQPSIVLSGPVPGGLPARRSMETNGSMFAFFSENVKVAQAKKNLHVGDQVCLLGRPHIYFQLPVHPSHSFLHSSNSLLPRARKKIVMTPLPFAALLTAAIIASSSASDVYNKFTKDQLQTLAQDAPTADNLRGVHILLDNDVDTATMKHPVILLSNPRSYKDSQDACASLGEGNNRFFCLTKIGLNVIGDSSS